MSALTKPLIKFTNAINNTVTVPVEYVQSAEKVDYAAAPNAPASTAVYSILFTVVFPHSENKIVKIDFTTAGARNTSFTNYQTANVTSVA